MPASQVVKFPFSADDADEDGLVAVGGRLEPELLLAAYRAGIFPWSSRPRVTWWSPDPRALFELDGFRPHRSVARSIKRGAWRFSVDEDFRGVMRGCAEAPPDQPERASTWITADFHAAYGQLHASGHAHSVEVWQGEALVGGVYGVTLGAFFGAESMFHRVTDASKAAIGFLVARLRAAGYQLLDAQVMNPHLAYLGALNVPRAEYLVRLKAALDCPVAALTDGARHDDSAPGA